MSHLPHLYLFRNAVCGYVLIDVMQHEPTVTIQMMEVADVYHYCWSIDYIGTQPIFHL